MRYASRADRAWGLATTGEPPWCESVIPIFDKGFLSSRTAEAGRGSPEDAGLCGELEGTRVPTLLEMGGGWLYANMKRSVHR